MSGMRMLLSRIDQLRRATVETLPAYSEALVAQFEEVKASTDAWAGKDHNDDGTHGVLRIGGVSRTPDSTVGRISLYWDGTNLKWVKPDGSTGNLV